MGISQLKAFCGIHGGQFYFCHELYSDVLIAVFDVERRSAGIDVLGDEVPAVVGQRAFAAHGGDGSFHGASFLVRGWVAGGSVTLVKSNAKALLTLRIKSALALSEGKRGLRRGLGALPMAYRPHGRDRSVSRSCQRRRTNGFTNGSRQASRCFRGNAAAPVRVRLRLRRFCTG